MANFVCTSCDMPRPIFNIYFSPKVLVRAGQENIPGSLSCCTDSSGIGQKDWPVPEASFVSLLLFHPIPQ